VRPRRLARVSRLLSLTVLIQLLDSSASAQGSENYRVFEVSVPGASRSRLHDMNNRHQAVGHAVLNGRDVTFRWTPDRGIEIMSGPGARSSAQINDDGDIAVSDGAVVWFVRGALRIPIPQPPGFQPIAVIAFSNNGQIVTYGYGLPGRPYTAITTLDGTTRLSEREYSVEHMSPAGDICASDGQVPGRTGTWGAVVYWADGTMDVPDRTPAGRYGCELVSAGKHIVEFRNGPIYRYHDGVATLVFAPANDIHAFTRDINRAGEIVGEVGPNRDAAARRAFLFGDRLIDLNTRIPAGSGWHLRSALAITDDGWIIGDGFHHGRATYYVLIPDGAGAPAAPTLHAPIVNGSLVTLTWAAAGATYDLEVGTSPGATNVLAANVGPLTTVSGTVPPGTYYYRLYAVNWAGRSSPSAEGSFAVTGPAPPSPPTNVAFTRTGRRVTVTWSPSAGAVQYILEAGTSPGSANVFNGSLGGTLAITADVPPGTYHVRVRARSAAGTSGPSNDIAIVVP
jgi:hypothetical protein